MALPRLVRPDQARLQDRRITRRADLRPINNLKLVFREIRDYFAGNVTGITRDEKIAQNMMRLLFCKIYDEKTNSDALEFVSRPFESEAALHKRICALFGDVKKAYHELFEPDEKIEVGPSDLLFIVSKFEGASILNADRDVIGDAFEELIGTSFRGGEGQFFTPRNVVQMMIDILDPKEGERIIDPACGSGGFLAYTLRHFLARGSQDFYIAGIDKDAFLAKIAKVYLSLIGESSGSYDFYCENSLDNPAKWSDPARASIWNGEFDIVLTNPPFGAKIPVVGKQLLRQYRLGHKWQRQKNGAWITTSHPFGKRPPQILFIERCIQLLKEGGRMGIVLPEGVFGNPSDRYIWDYVSSVCSVTGVVSLPQETFQPSTHTKTSVLFLEKKADRNSPLFMAIARSVGHNKNGKPLYKLDDTGKEIPDDDVPAITNNFLDNSAKTPGRLGFQISRSDLNENIFIPEYYNPEIRRELNNLQASGNYKLVPLQSLLNNNALSVTRGNEIGSRHYGTGKVPFVRTSDIVNWEIKFDPIKSVSEEVYRQYKHTQDIRERDILFVSDGTFLIGRTAMVTRLDLRIIIQSHLKKIRVLDEDFINPYYLFYLLNSKIVRKQIDSKTFVQSTISTIGNRLGEVVLPINTDDKEITRVTNEVKSIISQKTELRERTMNIIQVGV